MSEHQLPPRKSNSIFFLIVILFMAGIVVYQYILRQKDREIIDQNQVLISEKSANLDKVSHKLDSMRMDVDQKLQELIKLKGDTASIARMKREIENDLRRSREKNQASMALISNLQDKIEEYEETLLKKDREIEDLKEKFNLASKDNKELKNTLVAKDEQIQRLAEEKDNYKLKADILKKLKAETIKVSIIDTKGKEKEDEDYKAKKIGKLKISFTIADNPEADIGNKEVYLRILGPEGDILGDASNGGGVFMLDGRESPYTSKLSFLFDNKQAPPSFFWEKGSTFSTGTYTIELYSEGYRLGQANFKVR